MRAPEDRKWGRPCWMLSQYPFSFSSTADPGITSFCSTRCCRNLTPVYVNYPMLKLISLHVVLLKVSDLSTILSEELTGELDFVAAAYPAKILHPPVSLSVRGTRFWLLR